MRRVFAAIAAALLSSPALAQRADDDAVKSASDAFGASVGNESIGLYRPVEVRGFSALDAGNARIDGLYFDRQTELSSAISPGQTIRVGISAQGYPLPAPTGIVDSELVRVGDERVISVVGIAGAYDGLLAELDAKLPIVKGRFGVALGASLAKFAYDAGNDERDLSLSIAAQWRPTDRLEIIPFYDRYQASGGEAQPLIFVDGPFLPPRHKRSRSYGQDWTENENVGTNAGVVATADLGHGWAAKGGVFRSVFDAEHGFVDLFLNTTADGVADHLIIADAPQRFASTSGEARVSRTFEEGGRRHTIYLVARGRDQDRRFGGSDVLDFGKATIGVPVDLAEPAFTFGPQTRDKVTQLTGAVAYQGRFGSRLEVSAGLQRTRYRKTVREPGADPQRGRDDAFLYNAAAAWKASEALAFYGSYTTGLEEGGTAPENAANKNAAPPAIRTKQFDAGLRYAITPKLRLVAGVFDVRKPYFNLDGANIYRRLGAERRRGIEVSLSGELAKGLRVVAGTVLQDPQVTGEEVEAGRIGKIPVAAAKRLTIASLDYQLPWVQGLSVNAGVTSISRREASQDNRLQIPARATVDLSARYRFKLGDAPATIRFSALNVFNKYGYRTSPSAVFTPLSQRRFSLSLAADF